MVLGIGEQKSHVHEFQKRARSPYLMSYSPEHTEMPLTFADTIQADAASEHGPQKGPKQAQEHSQSLEDLPSPHTRRWDTKRKAQVVEAVRSGRITLDQACEIYAMSVDEFLAWQSLFDRYGAKGLMATRVKEFRERRIFG